MAVGGAGASVGAGAASSVITSCESLQAPHASQAVTTHLKDGTSHVIVSLTSFFLVRTFPQRGVTYLRSCSDAQGSQSPQLSQPVSQQADSPHPSWQPLFEQHSRSQPGSIVQKSSHSTRHTTFVTFLVSQITWQAFCAPQSLQHCTAEQVGGAQQFAATAMSAIIQLIARVSTRVLIFVFSL